MASAARLLTRKSAEKILSGFLDRVRAVNESDHFLYNVTRVLIFGSYLTDSERLGDIDIAIEVHHRVSDFKERERVDRARIQKAYAAGRSFPNIVKLY